MPTRGSQYSSLFFSILLTTLPLSAGTGIEIQTSSNQDSAILARSATPYTLPAVTRGDSRKAGIHREIPTRAFELARWITGTDGKALWQFRIDSPGAAGVRLRIVPTLAHHGVVTVRSGSTGALAGSYAWPSGRAHANALWTALVPGESIVLEFAPADGKATGGAPLAIPTLSEYWQYGHWSWTPNPPATCQLDVSCSADWADSANSVAMLVSEMRDAPRICTGTLVNTSDNSKKPYVLTTSACINSVEQAESTLSFWKFQTKSCKGDVPLRDESKVIEGAKLLVARDASDGGYSLLELPEVPEGATFAAWDPTAEPAKGAALTTIHHPQGNYKNIASGVRVEDQGTEALPAEKYYTVDLDKGRLEPGSFGAPLFSAPGKLAGFAAAILSDMKDVKDVCTVSPLRTAFGRFSAAYPVLKRHLEPGERPRVTAPVDGTELNLPTVTFEWEPGTAEVKEYALAVGTTPGGTEIFFESTGTDRKKSFDNIPIDGKKIYVQLLAQIGDGWYIDNFVYQTHPLPDLVMAKVEAPSTVIAGDKDITVKVTVKNQGLADAKPFTATLFIEKITESSGQAFMGGDGPECEFADGLAAGASATCQITLPLPADIEPGDYAVLAYADFLDYMRETGEYDNNGNGESPTIFHVQAGLPGVLATPAPSSRLTATTIAFTWSAGRNVTHYKLQVGSTAGGAQFFDGVAQTTTTATVNNITADGKPVYVRLSSEIAGAWQFTDYTFTAASPSINGTKAVMVTPAQGANLNSSSITFEWSAGTNVTEYSLAIGNSPGTAEIYNASQGLGRARTVNVIPLDGRKIYSRLGSKIGGEWVYSDNTYTAANVPNLPDLIILDVTGPAKGIAGKVLPNVQVTIRNRGAGSSGGFRASVYLSKSEDGSTVDADLYYTCAASSLSGTGSGSCTGSPVLSPDIAPGTYYLAAWADRANTVTESDETNNFGASRTPIVISQGANPPAIKGADVLLRGTLNIGDVSMSCVGRLNWWGTSYSLTLVALDERTYMSGVLLDSNDIANFEGDTLQLENFTNNDAAFIIWNHDLPVTGATVKLKLGSSKLDSPASAEVTVYAGGHEYRGNFSGAVVIN